MDLLILWLDSPNLSIMNKKNKKLVSQVAIEKTHGAVMQLRERAEHLLHCNSRELHEKQATVASRWENLVTCAEDRYVLWLMRKKKIFRCRYKLFKCIQNIYISVIFNDNLVTCAEDR